jgi:hypothetical protein
MLRWRNNWALLPALSLADRIEQTENALTAPDLAVLLSLATARISHREGKAFTPPETLNNAYSRNEAKKNVVPPSRVDVVRLSDKFGLTRSIKKPAAAHAIAIRPVLKSTVAE